MHAMNTGPTLNAVHTSPAVVQASQALNHCPPASQIFHGRQAILDSMHLFFARDTGKQKRYVLHGLGGAGKTQSALKFIEEWTKLSFTDRLLVDAGSRDNIETGLKNITVTKQAGNSSQDTLTWLASKHEEWLLFLDNADDPTINLNHWFPKCNHGNIIVTTRNHSARIHGAYSEVSNMEELDAVALLLKSALYESSPTNAQLAAEIVKNRTKLLKEKPTQMHDDYAWAYTKAEELQVGMMKRCRKCFGDDHSNTLHTMHRMGQFEEAEKIYVVVLEKRKKLLGDAHINTLHTMHDLALTYAKLGHVEEAEKLVVLEKEKQLLVLEKRKKLPGDDHLETLDTMHCLAKTYANLDQFEEAEKLYLVVLEKRKKLLGHNHLDTMHKLVITYQNLGQSGDAHKLEVVDLGQFEKAEQLEVPMLEKWRQLESDNHQDTLDVMENLAITYDNLGRTEEAKKLRAELLEKGRQS
ncbi:hypothetical protein C8R45DRAFT_1162418 [Mycena sanguinolenta]|nr:hypothetical protein C8R45DRAFT_1162418 [Mycena sanguinolenta]